MAQSTDTQTLSPENLKKLRLHLELSQQSFGMELGYTGFIAINRKENGVSPITRQDEIIVGLKFGKACKQLGIKIS